MAKNILVFDFDGVIVNSVAVSYAINKCTIPDLTLNEWRSWFEGNVYTTIRSELSSEAYQCNFFKEYGAAILQIKPVTGMVEVITKLAKSYHLVIISSSSEIAIKNYLKEYSLMGYFDLVLARETHKSKVDKLRFVLNKYSLKPTNALMITDTIGDIKEATLVGIKSIAVSWGVHNAKQINQAKPAYIVDSPKKLLQKINEAF